MFILLLFLPAVVALRSLRDAQSWTVPTVFFFKADKKRETLHTPETSNPMTVSCVSVCQKRERRGETHGEERRGEERRGED